MADTITSSKELKVGTQYADADTRLITIPNPQSGLTDSDITNAFSGIISDNVLIGDKTGASITGLYTAYIDNTTRVKLDLT